MSPMHAIILSIGDELVLGQTVDTNSAYLSAQLASLGIMTRYHITVADDQAAIVEAIALAARQAPLVIITGGLGPTEDDLTRQALAQVMGVPLVESAESVEAISGYFARRNRPMPQRNLIQAMHPQGSKALANSCGTAPGIRATIGDATIFVTPGVPSEMVAMYRASILPYLLELPFRRDAGRFIRTAKVNTFGIGESDLADRLGPLMDRARNPLVGTTVSQGIVAVRIRSEFADEPQARRELDATITQVESRLGPIVFGRDDDTLQQTLVRLLTDRRLTVATAESCTGGLLGAAITDVAGSSHVYRGGWVTYSNEMKTTQLGVPAEIIEQNGAVSAPVARAMAEGAMLRGEANLAAGITGVAGPGGGTAQKPVGAVWVAVASRAADGSPISDARLFQLPGNRADIRDRAAKCALQMLRFTVLGLPLDELKWGRRL